MADVASGSELESNSGSGSVSSEDDYLPDESLPPPPTSPCPSLFIPPDSVLCIQCGLHLPKSKAVRHYPKSWHCLRCHRQAFLAILCLEQRGEAAALARDLAHTRKAGALLSMQQSALLTAIDVKRLDIEKLRMITVKSQVCGRVKREEERQSIITGFILKLREDVRLTTEKVETLKGISKEKSKEEREFSESEVDLLYREVQKLERSAAKRRSILRKSIPLRGMVETICEDCAGRLSKHEHLSISPRPCLSTKSCSQQCHLM